MFAGPPLIRPSLGGLVLRRYDASKRGVGFLQQDGAMLWSEHQGPPCRVVYAVAELLHQARPGLLERGEPGDLVDVSNVLGWRGRRGGAPEDPSREQVERHHARI